MIPSELGRFFWDVDPASLNPKRHNAYIIERLLEFGNEKAARWLFEEYTRDEVAAVIESSRSLSYKSMNYWRLRLVEDCTPDYADAGAWVGEFQGTKVGFFHYPYALLSETVPFQGLAVASQEDIGCMKIEAIAGRGRKRDFIDLYFLLRGMGFDLSSLLDLYRSKYRSPPGNGIHVLKSLCYFVDADADPDPVMLVECSWPEIKRKLTALVQSISY